MLYDICEGRSEETGQSFTRCCQSIKLERLCHKNFTFKKKAFASLGETLSSKMCCEDFYCNNAAIRTFLWQGAVNSWNKYHLSSIRIELCFNTLIVKLVQQVFIIAKTALPSG